MSSLLRGNTLAGMHYVTVILRLVLDHRGRLVYGEILGPDTTPARRFRGWRGMNRALREWLAEAGQDGAPG
jgi:hypothetical protein